jgi:hypothetical protein
MSQPKDWSDLLLGIFAGVFTNDPDACRKVWDTRNPQWMDVMLGKSYNFSPHEDDMTLKVDKFYQRKINKFVSSWLGNGRAGQDADGWMVGFHEVNEYFSSGNLDKDLAFYTNEGRLPTTGRTEIIFSAAMRWMDAAAANGWAPTNSYFAKFTALRDAVAQQKAKSAHAAGKKRNIGDIGL